MCGAPVPWPLACNKLDEFESHENRATVETPWLSFATVQDARPDPFSQESWPCWPNQIRYQDRFEMSEIEDWKEYVG